MKNLKYVETNFPKLKVQQKIKNKYKFIINKLNYKGQNEYITFGKGI